jgi:hypothetical protein
MRLTWILIATAVVVACKSDDAKSTAGGATAGSSGDRGPPSAQGSAAGQKGLAVSTADLARVEAWIAGLAARTATLPKIMTKNGAATSRDELLHFLTEELSGQPLALDKITTVTYERELPARLVEVLKAPAGARLRSILIDHGSTFAVDQDNAITEGVQIHLIYDDHDAFLGIDISHYLYD